MITMLASSTDLDLLGAARPTEEELAAIASAALGRAVQIGTWSVDRVPYEAGSPATGALLRVRGRTTDGASWSVFLKVLQHPRHWARLTEVPPAFRADFVNSFPWRAELAAWEPEFLAALPAGLRVPRLYRLVELPDDRVAIWMEDVAISDDPWTVARFERGGRVARWAGRESLRCRPSRGLPGAGRVTGCGASRTARCGRR